MCGRVIQSSGLLPYAIVDGMNVRDGRVHNYPPRWKRGAEPGAARVRRNHRTGEVSLDPLRWRLISHWRGDPSGGRKPCETVRDLPSFCHAYRARRCMASASFGFEVCRDVQRQAAPRVIAEIAEENCQVLDDINVARIGN
jgi:putative SOS response-associated peptidase YedK